MNAGILLIKKEFVQMARDLRMVWLPIVFILLGCTQPIITYYLPTILEALGGGQGITIDSSAISQEGGEVLASTLGSQFDQLGIIILVVALMGIIQSDKSNGMLAFILTRPVSISSYLFGKVVSNYIVVVLSVTIGFFVSYLYVNSLFTMVPFSHFLIALLLYLLWVLFLVAFTLMISAIFRSQGIIALISIIFLTGCRIIVNFIPAIDVINPASLSKHASEVLATGTFNTSVIIIVFVEFIWILVLFSITNYWISLKKIDYD
ncbi:ABC transporter permease subunit [Ureibacillus sinduriensis]|uniref:Membrane protein n=1 Tax=Ureibacillus sinduriensis BLB-1 = JCM 15800 TaxID=1384057 RepID=A0A0A3HPA9_9BACL|nr:ABC transporter permease subunit [Ureibacillus sinduriensis]KGR74219.1 membrane protein [Ureibacillus sinduriensis BLB-1 = JCM 15800]